MKILTFDIEEWFHIIDVDATCAPGLWDARPTRIDANVDRILGTLTESRQRVTFFCLGWIARKQSIMQVKLRGPGDIL